VTIDVKQMRTTSPVAANAFKKLCFTFHFSDVRRVCPVCNGMRLDEIVVKMRNGYCNPNNFILAECRERQYDFSIKYPMNHSSLSGF
jgi:hypothetical protein